MQLLLKRRDTQEEYRVPAAVATRLVEGPDGVRAVVHGSGRVFAADAAAGGPLAAAAWDVYIVVIVAGFRATGRVRRARGAQQLVLAVTPDGRVAERRPGWRRNLRRRMPKPLVRAIRGARSRARR